MSTVVQVHVGVACLINTGRSNGLISLMVEETSVPGSTMPKSTPGGSATMGHTGVVCAGAGGAAVTVLAVADEVEVVRWGCACAVAESPQPMLRENPRRTAAE
jgi:hypothetical protein